MAEEPRFWNLRFASAPVDVAKEEITQITPSLTPVLFAAALDDRKGAAVFNSSDKDLYLSLGTEVTSDKFTVKLVPDAYYEVPFNYTGAMYGLWLEAATGRALVTEIS